MFLTATSLAPYLVARGLITPAKLVEGRFTVAESRRRNRGFTVLTAPGRGLFVKQVSAADSDAVDTLAREAACGALARTNAGFAAIDRLAPRLLDYDAARHVLVFDLVADAENLHDRIRRTGACPSETGRLVGAALGSWHARSDAMLEDPAALASFPRAVPWVLQVVACADGVRETMSVGNRHVLDLLRRSPAAARTLATLGAGWRRDGFVHGDVKWDNCLLLVAPDGSRELRIVDWELADVGDVAWDVGGALAAYLQHWVITVTHARPGATVADLMNRAPVRLDRLGPAIVAFWSAYTRLVGDAATRSGLRRRSAAYAGARLVQTAFELQGAQPRLSTAAVLCAQLGVNVMSDPDAAAAELLGLPDRAPVGAAS